MSRLQNTASKRESQFMSMLKEYKMNDSGSLAQYSSPSSDGKSSAYLISIKEFNSIKLPKNAVSDAKAFLSMSFFRQEDDGFQFYGRTARTKEYKLKKDGNRDEYSQKVDDCMFFHSTFGQNEKLSKQIYLIIEVIITFEKATNYKNKTNEMEYHSGGFACVPIFADLKKEIHSVTLYKGSPRLLSCTAINDLIPIAGSALMIGFGRYPRFDTLKQFVPQNNLVTPEDIIPGLRQSDGFKFPRPLPGGSKQNEKQVEVEKRCDFYLQKFCIIGNLKLDEEISNIYALMNIENQKDAEGRKRDKNDVRVIIKERRINIKCHNGWKQISETKTIKLSSADFEGKMINDDIIKISEFIPHELVAIIFEFEYVVSVQGFSEKTLCLGYKIHLPEYNSINRLQNRDLDTRLDKGPGETLFNQLMVSEAASESHDQIFDFVFQVYLSDTNFAAEPEKLKNRTSALYTKEERINQIEEKNRKKFERTGSKNIDNNENEGLGFGGSQSRGNVGSRFTDDYQYPNNSFQETMKEMREEQQRALRELQHQMKMAQSSGTSDQMQNLIDLQRQQLNQERIQMKEFMDKFMDDMIKLQKGNQRPNQEGVGFQDEGTGWGNEQESGIGFRQSNQTSQVDMSRIANLFYQMFNMIGIQKGDDRIIGLSNELRQQIQSKKFDQLFSDNVPYAGYEKVNLLKTIDLSLQDQEQLMRNGFGDLLKHPTNQLLSSSIFKQEYSLNKEQNDPQTASEIQISFAAFKTPMGNLNNVPKNFQFRFRFFTFPTVQTEFMGVVMDQNKRYDPDHVYYLRKTHSRMPQDFSNTNVSMENIVNVKFDIDPSISKIKDEHMQLAQYLKERFLTIDIFDAETQFFYGSCKIPLFELMRQGYPQVVKAKDCEIFNPEGSKYQGFLQVILSNLGKLPSIHETSEKETKLGKQPTQKSNRHVISRPLDINQWRNSQASIGTFERKQEVSNENYYHSGQYYADSLINQITNQQLEAARTNPDLQKRLRVDRIKRMMTGSSGIQTKGSQTIQHKARNTTADYEIQRSLMEIDLIRQTKKNEIIKSVMGGYVKNQPIIPLTPGQAYFHTIKLENFTRERKVYTVDIDDPDFGLTEKKEVQMVYTQQELEYWARQGKYEQEGNYQCITNEDSVLLDPGKSINLVFKFLTFRELSLDASVPSSSSIVKQRVVRILIRDEQVESYECNLMPTFAPIDHTFRFYEPENSWFKVSIPPFLQLNNTSLRARTSNPKNLVQIDQKTQSISVSSKTNRALQTVEIMVYIYADEFYGQLVASIKVEVIPLPCLYVQTRAGAQNSIELSLPVENSKEVQIYSNDPSCVFMKDSNLFRVIPGSINHIPIITKTTSTQEKRAVVNAIDSQTGDLIYSWMFLLKSLPPVETRNPEVVQAKVHVATNARITYTNNHPMRGDRTIIYDVYSSRPDILQPVEQTLLFRGNTGKNAQQLNLEIFPQDNEGSIDVFLFISDRDQEVMDCIKVQIEYIDSLEKRFY